MAIERSRLMITETMYVLAVPNLARSGDFYREVLGFEVREMGDPGWRMFVKDTCRIMAGECPDAIAPRDLGDHSYFGYLIVEGVDDYYERARCKGAELLKLLRDEPWGMREFGLRTVDGHRIMIGSRLRPAASEGGPTRS
jgi:catechol 2,3-dioxygenase-like lactoylglutathione lyase family enzyme